MKDAGWIVSALLFGIIVGFGLGTWYAKPVTSAYPTRPIMTENQPPGMPQPPAMTAESAKPPTPDEWQDYHKTREQVLQTNPQLAAEYHELLDEINKHQQDIEAAMVKADPKAAPIVTKLASMRERNMAQTLSATSAK
jgi:hypothetical protein